MAKNKLWFAIGASILISAIAFALLAFCFGPNETNLSAMINTTIPASNIALNIQTPFESIAINANEPESPNTFPYYKAYYAKGDVDVRYFKELFQERFNLTSVENAPEVARKAMEPYGGIPSDAYVAKSEISKGYIGGLKKPTKIIQNHNEVYFSRTVNGIPLTGMDDGIIVWLGENGELLGYKKFWRTLEPMGSVPVISVGKAIQKMGNREFINPPQNPSDALVTQINLRYYAKSWNAKEIYLEPVWDFYAILPSGNPYEFFVYARQFASFTETPATGKDRNTISFTDTSDASPLQWLWDFGDGTTSMEQNPTHTYKTAGNYTVTLTVWNDLGSDTVTEHATVGAPVSP